jgi:hypothetical protein
MKLQEVVCALLAHIKTVTGKEGKGLAIADKQGHFLLMFEGKAGGDFERVMLDDRAGDTFYIRLKDGRTEETAALNYKRGGCNKASRISARCRLVVQSECSSIATLAWNFRAALNSFRPASLETDVFSVSTSVSSILWDFTSIFFEEITQAEREGESGWEGPLQILAIDFTINYTLEGCNAPTQIC